jgi:Protein of unknown function (DUF2971)
LRVYHFVNKQFGLENIQRRRLKIARINELNDPFEWHALTSSDPLKRQAVAKLKEAQAVNTGLLCFSRDWRNPVQWSHYADNHRGVCLGFDVSDHLLGKVVYRNKRLDVDWVFEPKSSEEGNNRMRQSLITKYRHWHYEKEMRAFVKLNPEAEIQGLYFSDFSDELALREVIVGALSDTSRMELTVVLGDLAPSVQCRKARLAFKKFAIVEQRKANLWI